MKRKKGNLECKQKVECMKCGEVLMTENKKKHVNRKHNGESIDFSFTMIQSRQSSVLLPKTWIPIAQYLPKENLRNIDDNTSPQRAAEFDLLAENAGDISVDFKDAKLPRQWPSRRWMLDQEYSTANHQFTNVYS